MNPENKQPIFPKGDKAPAEYFTGTAWVRLILPNDLTLHTQIGNVVFEPKARNNWHTHPGGQILIVTAGNGYYQEYGAPIRKIAAGDVVSIAPDVLHWHGAAHESEFTHIAINTNTQHGIVVWKDRVTDEEYDKAIAD